MYRWDAEKRRVRAGLSGPFKANPKFRYGLTADLRGENWDIRKSFQGPAPVLGSFNLRREAVAAEFAAMESGRWRWSAGAEVSHRDFRSVVPGTALTPDLLAKGYQLKQVTQVDAELWRLPERRMTLDAGASSQAGRIWSQPSHSFEKLQHQCAFIGSRNPKATTTKYSTSSGLARHLETFRLTNSSSWAWSATTISRCAGMSGPGTAERAAPPGA